MATDVQTDLSSFYQFIGTQLKNDPKADLSPEQAIVQWRQRQEEIEAIREGLADVEAGRTRPADEFIAEFREKYQIAEDA